MKAVIAVAMCLILLGCQRGMGGKADEDVITGNVTKCRDIAYETTQCSDVPYNYSTTSLSKQDQYMLVDHCVGGAKLTIKNLEKQSGIFKVTFTFETPIEGKISKIVEKEIGGKSSAIFEEKAQFRCAQEYTVDSRVASPVKQSCRVVNETRQECIVETN